MGTDWIALNAPLRLRLMMEGGLPGESQIGEAMRLLVGDRFSEARLQRRLDRVERVGKFTLPSHAPKATTS